MPCGQYMAKAPLGRIFYVPHISKVPQMIRCDFNHLSQSFGNLQFRSKIGGRKIDKIGRWKLYSTNEVRIGLVDKFPYIHKHWHILMVFAFFKFKLFHPASGMIYHRRFFTCGARSIPKDRSLNNIFLF